MKKFYKNKSFKDNCENYGENILDIFRYLEYMYIISFRLFQSELLWNELLRRFKCRIANLYIKTTKYENEINKIEEEMKKSDYIKQLDNDKIELFCNEYWCDFYTENRDLSRKFEIFILQFFGDEYVDLLINEYIKASSRNVELGMKLLKFESDRLTNLVDYLNLQKLNDDSENDKHIKHL